MTGHPGSIRRMFAGGNSSSGFHSFYDQIVKADASRVFLLKGGPGVGKSTFMQQISDTMRQKGYGLEYYHCSSDPDSLDALVIPELQTALIDGTAPHVVDPKNPGVVEEILNLGQFWNESGLRKNKDRIIELNGEIKECFTRAYTYLRLTGEIYRYLLALRQKQVRPEVISALGAEIRAEIFPRGNLPAHTFCTEHRKMFASAITPKGPVHHLEALFPTGEEGGKIFVLDGPPGSGKELILERMLAAAVEKGYRTETFHCPLLPEKPEHLWLPQLRTGIISAHHPHQYTPPGAKVIDLTPLLRPADQSAEEAAREAQAVYEDLLPRAVGWLQRAKSLHDQLEAYYIPHMDFAGIEELRRETLAKILR
ncbi:MAG TPA: ATPase [Bacillota bacterium]